jgi:hypothetical protein
VRWEQSQRLAKEVRPEQSQRLAKEVRPEQPRVTQSPFELR